MILVQMVVDWGLREPGDRKKMNGHLFGTQ